MEYYPNACSRIYGTHTIEAMLMQGEYVGHVRFCLHGSGMGFYALTDCEFDFADAIDSDCDFYADHDGYECSCYMRLRNAAFDTKTLEDCAFSDVRRMIVGLRIINFEFDPMMEGEQHE